MFCIDRNDPFIIAEKEIKSAARKFLRRFAFLLMIGGSVGLIAGIVLCIKDYL